MARKSKTEQMVEANLSAQQMESAIPKIERRIAELEEFDVKSVTDRSDPKILTLEKSLDTLLVSIFGANSIEYQRYRRPVTKLDTAPVRWNAPTPMPEIIRGLERGISTSKAHLETIKQLFREELHDSGHTSTGKALRAYEGLELHPAIESASGSLYKGGHYANAVEDAVKALNSLVRFISGIDDKDGTNLMEYVFNPKNPILKFNSLSDSSDVDEQKGFMMMLSGAVAGLRNPRAHRIIKDDPEMALEFISYISLLAKLVEKSNK